MEDTGKQKFERGWSEALANAEVSPRQEVWTGIEQELGNDSMKRRVVFYQRLAAASILFAFLAGAFGLYWREQHNTQLATIRNSKTKKQEQQQSTSSNSNAETLKAATFSIPEQKTTSKRPKFSDENSQIKKVTAENESRIVSEQNGVVAVHDQQQKQVLSMNEIALLINQDMDEEAKLNRNGFYRSVSQQIESAPPLPINLKGQPRNIELVRKLPAMPSAFLNREKENKYEEKWWASAGASAGTYNPNYSSSSLMASSGAYSSGGPSLLLSSVPAGYGSSYSVALTAAHRLSKRWVVQSGMQYMARSIDYTSNFTSYSGAKMVASLSDYATLNSTQVTASSPYQLESRSEYISIPFQAGYVLVDRKFSWLVNSGISSDIFIRNTLTDLSGQRSSYSESAGQTSPYRTFMWSALASTELSYKMGAHYRLALMPGMRYSLNQVMKSDQATQGNPLIWDIGFRFRYIFK